MTLSWYCMDPAGVLLVFGQVLVASAPPGRGRRSPRPGLFTASGSLAAAVISEATGRWRFQVPRLPPAWARVAVHLKTAPACPSRPLACIAALGLRLPPAVVLPPAAGAANGTPP